jgi:hypothetical protein
VDVGELVRGHRVIARGICLHGGRLVLQYEIAPGITARMERRGFPALLFSVAKMPAHCRWGGPGGG